MIFISGFKARYMEAPSSSVRVRRRAAVFVDARNMIHAQRKAGFMFDPELIPKFVSENLGLDVTGLFWYMSLPDHAAKESFRDALVTIGYTVRSKLLREHHDLDLNMIRDKASLEAEMVLDMINLVDTYDVAIVLSGDSNYTCVLESLRGRSKLSTVVSTHGVASREIRNACDHYIDIQSVRRHIEKKPNQTKS